MSTVIKVKNLSKKYIIGHKKEQRYTTLRDVMMYKLKSLGEQVRHPLSINREQVNIEEFWALKDINFEIHQGERLGIIGRNGAGKSTLLKLLSRITEPSNGSISIKGRVSSLLEVGTGFHPELTGRENIYLNGVILGMSKNEVKKNFDEIVDFSGVENFLDTPIKRYSTGMIVRLGFSVTAFLDAEILVVDEVLAVGDAGFQKKCLEKIDDVSKGGRTVLFVSHNMPLVEKLCPRVIILNSGKVFADTNCSDALSIYFSSIMSPPECLLSERTDRTGTGVVRIDSFQMYSTDGKVLEKVRTGQDVIFRFKFQSKVTTVKSLDFGFTVRHKFNSVLFRNRTIESGLKLSDPFPKEGYLDCYIPNFPLTEGVYSFGFRLLVDDVESDYITGAYAAQFDVVEGDYFKTGKITSHAPVLINHEWKIISS